MLRTADLQYSKYSQCQSIVHSLFRHDLERRTSSRRLVAFRIETPPIVEGSDVGHKSEFLLIINYEKTFTDLGAYLRSP